MAEIATVEQNGLLVKTLEEVLEREIILQKQYAKVLNEERECFKAFKTAEVEALTAKREAIYKDMKRQQDRRIELMKQFPEYRGRRLSELVQAFCHPTDAKRLITKINLLKMTVGETRQSGSEFSQIAQFSLNVVNGALSLLWSATQHVTRSYGRNGSLREKYHHSGTRRTSVIKEA